MRTGTKVIWLSVGAGLLFWGADGVLDCLCSGGRPTLKCVLAGTSSLHVYDRALALLLFIAFGIAISRALTKRRQAQVALAGERDMAQRYLDVAGVMLLALDMDGKVSLINKRGCEILGCQEGEVIGRRWFDHFVPARWEEHVRDVFSRMARGETDFPEYHENPILTSQGQERMIAWHNSPLTDAAGQIVGVLSSGEDITERKRAEEAVRESERTHRALFEGAGEGILVADIATKTFVYANRAICEMLGYSKEELMQMSVRDIHPEEDLPRVIAEFEAQARGEKTVASDIPCLRKDGSVVWMDICTTKVVLNGRECNVGFFTDTTERKRAEEALRESEEKYRLLVENANEAIVVAQDGILKFANPKATDITGYSPDELCMRPFMDFIHEDDRAMVAERYRRRTAGEEAVPAYSFRAVDKWGNPRWLEINAVGIDWEGRPATLNFLSDITDRKQMASQLLQAQKLESIGQLAAGVAHELNTPAQYVGDNTRFLKDSFASILDLLSKYDELSKAAHDAGQFAQAVASIERAREDADLEYLLAEIPPAIEQSLEGIERISGIVGAMKEFAHPDIDERTPTDINRAIESTVAVARNEWKYVAELELDLDDGLPPVPCLAGQFNQVILNIVINAAHAVARVVGDGSQGKGRITVQTRREGDWATIRVSDTGTGIPDEIRTRVFDPFFTTKDVGMGTGQGLAIAHSVVVKKHGGTISFDTEIGKGTTFVIRLPIGAGEVAADAA